MNSAPGQVKGDNAPDSSPGTSALLSFTKAIVAAMRRALPTSEAAVSRHLQAVLSGNSGDEVAADDATASAGTTDNDTSVDADHGASLGPLLHVLDDESPELRVIAFYLPPWEAWLQEAALPRATDPSGDRVSDATGWLKQWRDYHQRLLDMRSSRPARVTLINAGRLDAGSLAAMLKAAGHGSLHHLRIQAAVAWIPPVVEPLGRLLAGWMADHAPECWETYEQLESCALMHGREPEFRATSALVDCEEIETFLAAAREIQASMADDAAGNERTASYGPLLDELRDENELLTLQVEQLHEELEFQVRSGSQMRAILLEAGGTAEAARRLITRLVER